MTEKKIEQFWRDATAEDVARAMKGEKVEARFWDDEHRGKAVGSLVGWGRGEPCWYCEQTGGRAYFENCQVYEPQQWWLDKPDPGKGWRLLGKFPAEGLQPGDEWFEPDPLEKGWKVSHNERQANFLFYRRRIEPNTPEKLDSSPCASNIPKGWTALLLDEPRLASDAYWSQDAEAWIIIGDGWVEAANREKWPAIRQVENWRCMQLMEGCFYRLPNGQGIKVTKKGFELE
jgi:hypothetical protein